MGKRSYLSPMNLDSIQETVFTTPEGKPLSAFYLEGEVCFTRNLTQHLDIVGLTYESLSGLLEDCQKQLVLLTNGDALLLMNESGMYQLLSEAPWKDAGKVKAFREWISTTVIPHMRGSKSLPSDLVKVRRFSHRNK